MGEKSINSYIMRVPLRKKYLKKMWYSKAQTVTAGDLAAREGLRKGLEERVAGVAGEAQGSELFALCFALAALEPLLAGKELDQNGPGRRRSSERPWQPRIYLDEFHQGVLDSGAARSTSSTHVRPNDAGSVRGAGGAGRCGGARDKKRGRSRSRAGGRSFQVKHFFNSSTILASPQVHNVRPS